MPEIIGLLNVTYSSGSGAPTHVAPKGSLYNNTAAGSSFTRLYLNTTGASIWTAVTTLA